MNQDIQLSFGSSRESSWSRIASAFVRKVGAGAMYLRHYGLIAASSAFVVIEALRRGTDTYFDLLNVKWLLGWRLARFDFDAAGFGASRKSGFPLLDIWNATWSTTGVWWIPNLVHGAVHSLLVPLVYLLSRRASPLASNLLHQIVASLAVLMPLVRMQIGTSIGHLYSSIPLVCSLLILVDGRRVMNDSEGERRRLEPFLNGPLNESKKFRKLLLAGSILALMPLLKVSTLSLVPAHFVGLFFLVGSLTGAVVVALGFLSTYLFFAVGWSAIIVFAEGGTISNVTSPGIPVGGLALVTVSIAVVTVSLLAVVADRRSHVTISLTGSSPKILLTMTLLSAIGAVLASSFLRRGFSDERWLVTDLDSLFSRFLHAGDLQNGFLTIDLESPYFDTSGPIAVVLVVAVALLIPATVLGSTDAKLFWRVGFIIFVTAPFPYAMWGMGYTRYVSQVVPLVGVACVALISGFRGRYVRWWSWGVVIFALALPLISTHRASAQVPRFGQVAYDEAIYGEYVSGEELDFLNSLLPSRSNVILTDSMNSFLIPQLGREDIHWWLTRPKRFETAQMRGEVIVLFSPGEAREVDALAEHGVVVNDCSVIYFEHLSLGMCEAQPDPALGFES